MVPSKSSPRAHLGACPSGRDRGTQAPDDRSRIRNCGTLGSRGAGLPRVASKSSVSPKSMNILLPEFHLHKPDLLHMGTCPLIMWAKLWCCAIVRLGRADWGRAAAILLHPPRALNQPIYVPIRPPPPLEEHAAQLSPPSARNGSHKLSKTISAWESITYGAPVLSARLPRAKLDPGRAWPSHATRTRQSSTNFDTFSGCRTAGCRRRRRRTVGRTGESPVQAF